MKIQTFLYNLLMEIKSWMEVEANWDMMPAGIYDEFMNLLDEWNVKLDKVIKNKRVFKGEKEDILVTGVDAIEDIPALKKYFKIFKMIIKGPNGLFTTNFLNGKDYWCRKI